MNFSRFHLLILLFIIVFLQSCENAKSEKLKLFTTVSSEFSGINFINNLEFTEDYNPYTFKNFFNGGGVAVGDINNDGLMDLYFTGNLNDNKLYLNKGNLRFEDITLKAGVECKNVWSTGVCFVDINSDGWMDIYVCKSGRPGGINRNNELFINNKDLTFTEMSKEYGLDFIGLSTHAAFFDYDRDGDLDCYLLNNSIRSIGGYDIVEGLRNNEDSLGGNKLLKNDHISISSNGDTVISTIKFRNVTTQAGIYSSAIGFGLGVSISDLNNDGWQDIFVSNDFFERDYLYINKKDGTFDEVIEECMPEISLGSMGADIADINNDGWSDIFVTEMLPGRLDRYKSKAIFENWDKYQLNIRKGYHRQFGRNMLHLNNGDISKDEMLRFSDISRFSGVEATDWSWGALIADFNNDGSKDIFVANGIYKDLTDLDYINYDFDPNSIKSMIENKEKVIIKMMDKVPSEAQPNELFLNIGNLKFKNASVESGLGEPTFSNGSVYADLDNDGDLDLVTNNINQTAQLYKNNSEKENLNFINIKLIGYHKNLNAIGSKVICHHKKSQIQFELAPMKGFQSCVDNRIHIGLGKINKLDSIQIFWQNGNRSIIKDNIELNKFVTYEFEKLNKFPFNQTENKNKLFSEVKDKLNLYHSENDFSDFDRNRLLYFMISNEGPFLCVKDLNLDGKEDIVMSGSYGNATQVLYQDKNRFLTKSIQNISKNAIMEDGRILIEDFNEDGNQDIFVCANSAEHNNSSNGLKNKLYFGGKNTFAENFSIFNSLYNSTGCVVWTDLDSDGDKDLFTGGRLESFNYGIPPSGYVYENNNNTYTFSSNLSKAFKYIGMIVDGKSCDLDGDGIDELILLKDMSDIDIFTCKNNVIKNINTELNLDNIKGYWSSFQIEDLDNDGDLDILVCNKGLNNRFANTSGGFEMHVNDFDGNGEIEQISCYRDGDKSVPWVLKDDLVKQIPSLRKKILRYESYTKATLSTLFDEAVLNNSIVYSINEFRTGIFWNEKGKYVFKPLPDEAQWTDQKASLISDINNDGFKDIILGGNQFRAKPEIGINAASFTTYFTNLGNGSFKYINNNISGLCVDGEVRDIKLINIKNKKHIIFARNNANSVIYKINN